MNLPDEEVCKCGDKAKHHYRTGAWPNETYGKCAGCPCRGNE